MLKWLSSRCGFGVSRLRICCFICLVRWLVSCGLLGDWFCLGVLVGRFCRCWVMVLMLVVCWLMMLLSGLRCC